MVINSGVYSCDASAIARREKEPEEVSRVGSLTDELQRARDAGDPYVEGLVASGESLGEGIDLSYYEFHGVELDHCSLVRVNLAKASFYDCTLTQCDFSNAVLSEAFFSRTRLVGCKLEGAQLNGAILRSSRFVDCMCRYLNLGEAKLEGAVLERCDLREAFLSEVRLRRKTKLQDCDFTRADFFRASLRGVDISSCTLTGIGVSTDRSELRGAVVSVEQAPELAALLGVRFTDL